MGTFLNAPMDTPERLVFRELARLDAQPLLTSTPGPAPGPQEVPPPRERAYPCFHASSTSGNPPGLSWGPFFLLSPSCTFQESLRQRWVESVSALGVAAYPCIHGPCSCQSPGKKSAGSKGFLGSLPRGPGLGGVGRGSPGQGVDWHQLGSV